MKRELTLDEKKDLVDTTNGALGPVLDDLKDAGRRIKSHKANNNKEDNGSGSYILKARPQIHSTLLTLKASYASCFPGASHPDPHRCGCNRLLR